MTIDIQEIGYLDHGVPCVGRFLRAGARRPSLLIGPDWSGINALAMDAASRVHAHGFNAFVMDIYGNGKRGHSAEEKRTLMEPFMVDRSLLRQRLQAAFQAFVQLDDISSHKVGALGFCFGGLCALDIARSHNEIRAVASFHGLLAPPTYSTDAISARILALHGHDDPMVPPEQVLAFQQEMTRAKADWQMIVFGGACHAFANPEANDASMGTVYNEAAASRAWSYALDFFDESF